MKALKVLCGLLFFTVLMSCNNPSPRDYFDKAALNTNLITAFYTPNFFGEILELKAQNRLIVFREKAQKAVTAEEYLKDRLPDLSKNISEIKSLKKNEETKKMLEASIAYYEQADKIFKNDYPKIAKMIDDNKPQEEIKSEIDKIFTKNDPDMFAKDKRLMEAATVYARKNNIPFINRR